MEGNADITVSSRGVSFTDTTARTAPHLTVPKPILIGVGTGKVVKIGILRRIAGGTSWIGS